MPARQASSRISVESNQSRRSPRSIISWKQTTATESARNPVQSRRARRSLPPSVSTSHMASQLAPATGTTMKKAQRQL